jgi:CHASE3 domain sensor protein
VTARTAEGERRTASIMRERLVAAKSADAAFMHEQRERLEQEERERLMRLAAQKQAAAAEQKRLVWLVIGMALFVLAIGGLLIFILAL